MWWSFARWINVRECSRPLISYFLLITNFAQQTNPEYEQCSRPPLSVSNSSDAVPRGHRLWQEVYPKVLCRVSCVVCRMSCVLWTHWVILCFWCRCMLYLSKEWKLLIVGMNIRLKQKNATMQFLNLDSLLVDFVTIMQRINKHDGVYPGQIIFVLWHMPKIYMAELTYLKLLIVGMNIRLKQKKCNHAIP